MIPLAPLEEQRDIVERVEYYLQFCDTLDTQMKIWAEKQNKFSSAATQTMLKSDQKFGTSNKKGKEYATISSVEIRLVASMKKDIASTILAKILQQHGGKMEAKELWKASNLKAIDDFYAVLKREIDEGFIQDPDVAELRLVEATD